MLQDVFLDYEYIKNNYWLIAVDWRRQKELVEAIQQIEFIGQLKNSNDAMVANEPMFVSTI